MLAYETPTSAIDVVAVQRALNQILGAGLVEDGVLGPKTRASIQAFQRSQGLPAMGALTPATLRTLTQAARPNVPAAPPLVRQETVPPSLTLYVRLPLGGEGRAQPLTGIFFPDQYQAGDTIDAILYLHGHRKGQPTMAIDTYWKQSHFRFREALNGTHTNMVLVAPTLGLTSEAGWLVGKGGLERYLDSVLEAVSAHGPYGGRKPRLRHLILACHSGGGAPMLRLAINAGRYDTNVRECWGFDCLYNSNGPALWSAWARAHPQARLYIYWAGSTRELSLALQQRGLPNVIVEKSRNAAHNYVPITYWAERILDFSTRTSPQAAEYATLDREYFEQEGGIVSSFSDLLRRAFGAASPLASVRGVAEAAAAFASGERDANRLTDIVFSARHQERGGRPLARGETQLAQEWLWIRDNVVKPVLLHAAADPTPAPPTALATAPAGTPAASEFTRRTPTLRRMALLVPLLERYRGDIPLEFLLGWVAVESDGRIDVVTNLNERGFFQIHPDESKDRRFQHERLTTDPDYSVQAGIRNVRYYADLARQRFPSIPVGSELFWRIVKLQHAMGSGLTWKLLNSMRASNIALTWEEIKRYEVTNGPRLHRLLTKKPLGRFSRNVDGVFTRGREIARALGKTSIDRSQA